MSYQGIRKDRGGKLWVRYRVNGQIVEAGPYDNATEALRENMGRSQPPLTSVNVTPILGNANELANKRRSVK